MILIIALTLCLFFSGASLGVGAGAVSHEPTVTEECEGDACSQVTLTWDETKELYKVQNNSSDRWIRVEAANLVSSASVCLAPNKSDYLTLKSVVGAFRANLAENCGKMN